ncbi:DUF4433 domain-containing protein [Nonomuraea sp. C10]|uniref:DUF4433 domain-containing protein n=1 Tax=Nonomuraea sp. C10 TaxID=2600577 RepID=UPI0011CE3A20|nr:DUF4433 domain-containing protein [Nonomuraea sp. C10]TXK41478.1 DUF4433 domain-containing protein [Nonomuraea sp. C10]
MDAQTNPWLLHFTHVDNIEGITATGLVADNRQPATAVECAEPGIKERRRQQPVTIEPGGVVADYVPFYFAPRSPMLHRIHNDGVTGYCQGQRPLVYLVTRLEAVIAGAGVGGHCVNPLKPWRRSYATAALTRADDACLVSII